jgi:hypothetical protein
MVQVELHSQQSSNESLPPPLPRSVADVITAAADQLHHSPTATSPILHMDTGDAGSGVLRERPEDRRDKLKVRAASGCWRNCTTGILA